MKKQYIAIALLSSAPFGSAWANDILSSLNNIPGKFTGSVGITSDYTFRGITQTKENPAIQGNIDYNIELPDNFSSYAGVWGSNVAFNDNGDANLELDWYGGVKYKFDKMLFDVGALYYSYPGAEDNLNYDYVEYKAAATYDFGMVAVTGSINYSPDFSLKSGHAEYYRLGASAPLPHGFILDGYIGRQYVSDNTTFALPDYNDWGAGIGYNFKGVDLKLQYIDTNLSKAECADGCDAKAVFTVSKSF